MISGKAIVALGQTFTGLTARRCQSHGAPAPCWCRLRSRRHCAWRLASYVWCLPTPTPMMICPVACKRTARLLIIVCHARQPTLRSRCNIRFNVNARKRCAWAMMPTISRGGSPSGCVCSRRCEDLQLLGRIAHREQEAREGRKMRRRCDGRWIALGLLRTSFWKIV